LLGAPLRERPMFANLPLVKKMMIQAAIAAVLMLTMMANTFWLDHVTGQSTTIEHQATRSVENALVTQATVGEAQLAVAMARLAATPAALDAAVAGLPEIRRNGQNALADAAQNTADGEPRKAVEAAQVAFNAYLDAVMAFAKDRRVLLEREEGRKAQRRAWSTGVDEILTMPGVTSMPTEFESRLRTAGVKHQGLHGTLDEMLDGSHPEGADVARKLVAQIAEDLDAARAISDSGLAQLLGGNNEILSRLDVVRAARTELETLIDATAEAVTAQAQSLSGAVEPRRTDAFARVGAVNTVAHAALETATAAQNAHQTLARRLGLGIGLAAIVLGILSALMIARMVSQPIRQINAVLAALVRGERDVEIPFADRRDEVGEAARAAADFKAGLAQLAALKADEQAAASREAARLREAETVVAEVARVVEAAVAGDFTARVAVTTADPSLASLARGIDAINEAVDRATTELVAVLGGVAEGDLTRAVQQTYAGRFAEMKAAVNDTVARLAGTVASIKGAAGEVASSAGEINAGADDLSRRTEEQASSLEETAATTEQLAASVKASAQSSRQAVSLAEQAVEVARQGGDIVGRAVAAMERIDEASRKIGDITGVIDEIAFQTNLLALNAAIEAARAGEAGKGFAVVASEVRTLAQRSSEAAKDITGLIAASGTEVAAGVQLVRSAGDVLQQIVGASRRVTDTVAEIASASSEQASGIDEISHAVAHLDGMTQQNAALAEESAASATALSRLIGDLNTMMAGFRVPAGHRADGTRRAA